MLCLCVDVFHVCVSKENMNRLIQILVGFVCSSAIAISHGEEGIKPPIILDPEIAMNEAFVSSLEFEGVWRKWVGDNEAYSLKVIKDGHWAVKGFAAEDGGISMYFGGSYIFAEGIYVEKVEFLETSYGPRIGSTWSYEISVEDDVLSQSGIGKTRINEEWMRVEINSNSGTDISISDVIESDIYDDLPILDSLVIIKVSSKHGGSNGSGFVVEMDGKKYLITNQHVVDCCESIDAITLANERIVPVSIEICPSLDLIRMEITNDVPTLTIMKSDPIAGDAIVVYGNSGGGGVATKIRGKILAVGQNRVEVDAEFVGGNSGCPILNDSHEVVGVATYATRFEDPENWLKKDARFQEIRRYGYRLNDAKWNAIAINKFADQGKIIADLEQAIFTYAITYISFRTYTREPHPPSKPSKYKYITQKYQDEYGNWQTETVKVPNYNYEKEYREWEVRYDNWLKRHRLWEEKNEYFRLADPDNGPFYSRKLKKKCDEHFRRADELFFGKRKLGMTGGSFSRDAFSIKQAHQGKLYINIDAMEKIHLIKNSLLQTDFLSEYLESQAHELIALCDYILEFDTR